MKSRNLIGGEWITPTEGTVSVFNPSNLSEEVGVLYMSGVEDMLAAGISARKSLPMWSGMTGAARAECLFRTSQLLEQNAREVATLASSEMGKPITEMVGEVVRGVNLLRYYAGEGVRSNGNVIPATSAETLQYTRRVPLGVTGIITPWNFPVAIPLWKIAPALICGNTVIWKPAEVASLTATRIAELFVEAGLAPGALNLVIGKGSTIGNAMLERVELDGVSFTGSTETGQRVAVACAKRNIRYQTEMGGKNAAIVLKDADLSTTVPALLSGAFRSAGQKCTATSRIVVEDGILDELVERLRSGVSSLRVGSALEVDAYLGPVASKEQHDQVSKYVDLAKRETVIVAQGQSELPLRNGHYVLPIIASGVNMDHALVQEEIFGPVATIIPVQSLEEAIFACNQSMYGLSASIFTNTLSAAFRFLDEAQAGMVRVNLETAGVEYQAPFGGMKLSSSHTREQGQAALDFYTQTKTCAVYYNVK